MIVDVIMLANGSKGQLRSMTQQAINSIHASEKDIQFEIVVVESVPGVTYKHCKVVYPMQDRFNYNTATLFGLDHIRPEAEYVLFVNNDIKAYQDFARHLVDALLMYDSVSPVNPMMPEHKIRETYKEGFNVREIFCGWAFMLKKKTIDEIGAKRMFPSSIEGWYSDNWLSDLLQSKAKKHALVRYSRMDHLESKTLRSVSRSEHDRLTYGQRENYDKMLNGLE